MPDAAVRGRVSQKPGAELTLDFVKYKDKKSEKQRTVLVRYEIWCSIDRLCTRELRLLRYGTRRKHAARPVRN